MFGNFSKTQTLDLAFPRSRKILTHYVFINQFWWIFVVALNELSWISTEIFVMFNFREVINQSMTILFFHIGFDRLLYHCFKDREKFYSWLFKKGTCNLSFSTKITKFDLIPPCFQKRQFLTACGGRCQVT